MDKQQKALGITDAVYSKMIEEALRLPMFYSLPSIPRKKRSRFYFWRKRKRTQIAVVLHKWVEKIDYVCESDY